MNTAMVAKGLAGVVVDECAISNVDGENGVLSYRGRHIDDLLEHPFERVAWWVAGGEWNDALTTPLAEASVLSADETQRILALPASLHPMQALIAMAPALEPSPAFDNLSSITPEVRHGFTVAAKLPSIIATLIKRKGPTTTGSYVERLLSAATNYNDAAAHAFKIAQILQLEHSFNAGTFAARVTASTLAPIENCLASAYATLHGVLHGGADQAALEMADSLADPADAEKFVDGCVARGEKIMGMGHREYRVVDPRSLHVKPLAASLTKGTPHETTFAKLEAIEKRFSEHMAKKGKAIHPNLEFYKGLVYRALGFDNQYFTTLFAMARTFGYLAHFVESRTDNRIMRPAARYVGPPVTRA